MSSPFRDTAFGVLVRPVTKGKALQYPEEKPDFKLPEPWVQLMNNEKP